MYNENCIKNYIDARKMAKKEFNRGLSRGVSGYVPALEGILLNAEILSEQDLGVVSIPLKKIKGIYSYSRSSSFASNFMPLLVQDSEFASKWIDLCSIHIDEGIRDPIKVYEYLNWFYVVEGNKRTSILKYMDAISISARVTRLIPKKDDNNIVLKLYYEFMDFNKRTGIYSIWFSKPGAFSQLLEYLDKLEPEDIYSHENKYIYFEKHIYYTFRKAFMSFGGQSLNITTGDAFLEYAKIYGIKDDLDEQRLKNTLKKLMAELGSLSDDESNKIQTDPKQSTKGNIVSTISTLVTPKKKLKIAYAYAKTMQSSGWTYAHELGRLHVEKSLGDQISTTYIDDIPENEQAYLYIKCLAEENYDIIFTTSPTLIITKSLSIYGGECPLMLWMFLLIKLLYHIAHKN